MTYIECRYKICIEFRYMKGAHMDKTFVTRSTGMLLLKLIESEDMYGYQMIEELARRSDDTFTLKAGTLYPMLHDLEKAGLITAYEKTADTGRVRKYYSITKAGRAELSAKTREWREFSRALDKVLGGVSYAF